MNENVEATQLAIENLEIVSAYRSVCNEFVFSDWFECLYKEVMQYEPVDGVDSPQSFAEHLDLLIELGVVSADSVDMNYEVMLVDSQTGKPYIVKFIWKGSLRGNPVCDKGLSKRDLSTLKVKSSSGSHVLEFFSDNLGKVKELINDYFMFSETKKGPWRTL